MDHIIKGKSGENLALEYLVKAGYEILETNWRIKDAEIDIIAMLGDTMIFVEVKTRSYTYGKVAPAESVNYHKEQKIFKAANAYKRSVDYDWFVRFDIITIIHRSDDDFELKHYEDAFYPGSS